MCVHVWSLHVALTWQQGLSIPSSDVDIVVCDVKDHYRAVLSGTKAKHACIDMLAARLRVAPWVQGTRVLANTAMPIIKLHARTSAGAGTVKMDISFDAPSHRGLATAALVLRMLRASPVLMPLTLVLKQLLVQKGLNDPYTGGLSSYGLVLLVYSFLSSASAGVYVGKTRALSPLKALDWRWPNDACVPHVQARREPREPRRTAWPRPGSVPAVT